MTHRAGPGLQLNEELTDTVIAALQGGIPDKLAELEAQYDDDVTLDAPQDVDYYSPYSERASSLNVNYPSMYIIVADVVNNIHEEAVGEPDWILSYTLFVFPIVKSENKSDLFKIASRVTVAVIEVLCQPGALGDTFVHFLRATYDRPALTNPDEGKRDVPLEFICETNESFQGG